ALDVNSNPLFLKALGNIFLYAGDNLTVQQGALLQAGTSIVLVGDYKFDENGNALAGDPGLGSTIDVRGTLTAPTITISGGNDPDIIEVTTGTLTAAYPWTLATWPFNPLGLAFQAPGATPSLITVNGNGGDDQIMLWGAVTAKETDING